MIQAKNSCTMGRGPHAPGAVVTCPGLSPNHFLPTWGRGAVQILEEAGTFSGQAFPHGLAEPQSTTYTLAQPRNTVTRWLGGCCAPAQPVAYLQERLRPMNLYERCFALMPQASPPLAPRW